MVKDKYVGLWELVRNIKTIKEASNLVPHMPLFLKMLKFILKTELFDLDPTTIDTLKCVKILTTGNLISVFRHQNKG